MDLWISNGLVESVLFQQVHGRQDNYVFGIARQSDGRCLVYGSLYNLPEGLDHPPFLSRDSEMSLE